MRGAVGKILKRLLRCASDTLRVHLLAIQINFKGITADKQIEITRNSYQSYEHPSSLMPMGVNADTKTKLFNKNINLLIKYVENLIFGIRVLPTWELFCCLVHNLLVAIRWKRQVSEVHRAIIFFRFCHTTTRSLIVVCRFVANFMNQTAEYVFKSVWC